MNQPCSPEDAAQFIKAHVLPSDFEGMIRNLAELARSRRKKRDINSFVKGLRLEMSASSSTRAGINMTKRIIVLPDGFLRSRWCSAYRALGLMKGPAGFDAFNEAFPIGDSFGWPQEIPAPDGATPEIAAANKIYPYVILPTILHEIGHLVNRDRCAPARRIELACDAFAIDFLAHSNRPNAVDVLILGLAVWMCCMCAESLRYDEFTSTSHPSPAQRMERLFARRLPRTHSRNMKAFRVLCFGQLVNLAKIRREDLVEQINNRDYGSFVARIHALRKCWGPRA